MIRQIAADDPLLQQIVGHPLLAADIGGRAACPQPGQDFWVVEQDCTAVGFLCRVGEALYTTGAYSQSEELLDFAFAAGFRQLITDLALPLEIDIPILAMEHSGIFSPICGGYRINFFTQPSSQFSAVAFAELQRQCRVLSTDEEAQRYAVNLSHEMRNGFAAAVTEVLDGRLAAGATLCRLYHGTVVLESVAVLPRYRGQGLGHTIAAAACQLAAQLGVTPLLCCDPALEPLYRSVGFAPLPPIYCYTPHRKEQQYK